MDSEKKNLTNSEKPRYNGDVHTKHCCRVQAFTVKGNLYIKCSQCGQWIPIKPTGKLN